MQVDPRPTRSAAWRGALWITLIALLSTSVALTVQYLQTTRTADARRQAAVDDEASGLVERYRSDGLGGVAQAIQRQQSIARIHEFFYLLALPDGSPVAGNLSGWPSEIETAGFHRFETEVANTRGLSSRRWVEARAVVLDGGVRLLVGDFADERAALRERYLGALFWSLIATGALGLVFGWWYSRRGLAFVRTVADAGDRLLAGELATRLPVSPRGDEYDRLAETLNRTFAEVERLIGSLRAATDGMAHDLRTPLTRIRARLELAEIEHRAGDAARDAVDELDGMLKLIDDMLSIARAEATPASTFRIEPIDAIAQEAVDLYAPLAEDRGLRLDLREARANVVGSRSLLARLVANLLDNAVKFTPPGGSVLVTVEADRNGAVLAVADDGPGIPIDRREEMLGRFRRADESRSTPGSGLGLSVVEVIARVHGARLALLDNRPGLRVEVRFPPPADKAPDED